MATLKNIHDVGEQNKKQKLCMWGDVHVKGGQECERNIRGKREK